MILIDRICEKCRSIKKDVDSGVVTICDKCSNIMTTYYGTFQLGTANDHIPTSIRKKKEKIPFIDSKGKPKPE